ncbi:hypothetical protein CPB83DRAFT_883297 [Crepidotus variabilis]|uniref:Uncharacterized protein n=1 Tax=Crepidotus variabilis TaxID=179855 RepID=A0A9P6EH14_9AGAR|nr:hypothetical protein CPB83DRAFT_883297 [Crepidotus variabilis]
MPIGYLSGFISRIVDLYRRCHGTNIEAVQTAAEEPEISATPSTPPAQTPPRALTRTRHTNADISNNLPPLESLFANIMSRYNSTNQGLALPALPPPSLQQGRQIYPSFHRFRRDLRRVAWALVTIYIPSMLRSVTSRRGDPPSRNSPQRSRYQLVSRAVGRRILIPAAVFLFAASLAVVVRLSGKRGGSKGLKRSG